MSDSEEESEFEADSSPRTDAQVMAMSKKNKERAPPFAKIPDDERQRKKKVSHAREERKGIVTSTQGVSAQDRIDQFNKRFHNIKWL